MTPSTPPILAQMAVVVQSGKPVHQPIAARPAARRSPTRARVPAAEVIVCAMLFSMIEWLAKH